MDHLQPPLGVGSEGVGRWGRLQAQGTGCSSVTFCLILHFVTFIYRDDPVET